MSDRFSWDRFSRSKIDKYELLDLLEDLLWRFQEAPLESFQDGSLSAIVPEVTKL